jgi:hypothetical protein
MDVDDEVLGASSRAGGESHVPQRVVGRLGTITGTTSGRQKWSVLKVLIKVLVVMIVFKRRSY